MADPTAPPAAAPHFETPGPAEADHPAWLRPDDVLPYAAPVPLAVTVHVAGMDRLLGLTQHLLAAVTAVNENLIAYGEQIMTDFSKLNSAQTDLVGAVADNAAQTHTLTAEVHDVATQLQAAINSGDQATVDALVGNLVTATGNLKDSTNELASDLQTLKDATAAPAPSAPPEAAPAADGGAGQIVDAGAIGATGSQITPGADQTQTPGAGDGQSAPLTNTPGA